MCDNCGCKTDEIAEVTIQELLEKQAADRANVFRPILKKMIEYLKESDVDAYIEPGEFAALTIVTKNWEASLDLINFYERENKKEEDIMEPNATLELGTNGLKVLMIDDEDDLDDDNERICSSCLTDVDDEPTELRTYVAPAKKKVYSKIKKVLKKKPIKNERKSKGK